MDGTLKANVRFMLATVQHRQSLTGFTVDYNSWIESDTGRKLADSLDKDVVLAEGAFWSHWDVKIGYF